MNPMLTIAPRNVLPGSPPIFCSCEASSSGCQLLEVTETPHPEDIATDSRMSPLCSALLQRASEKDYFRIFGGCLFNLLTAS